MKREELDKKRFEHRLKCFNLRLKKIGYPPLSDVIIILKDLFNFQLDWIEDEGDVFENDCFALKYAIEVLEILKDNESSLIISRKNEVL